MQGLFTFNSQQLQPIVQPPTPPTIRRRVLSAVHPRRQTPTPIVPMSADRGCKLSNKNHNNYKRVLFEKEYYQDGKKEKGYQRVEDLDIENLLLKKVSSDQENKKAAGNNIRSYKRALSVAENGRVLIRAGKNLPQAFRVAERRPLREKTINNRQPMQVTTVKCRRRAPTLGSYCQLDKRSIMGENHDVTIFQQNKMAQKMVRLQNRLFEKLCPNRW